MGKTCFQHLSSLFISHLTARFFRTGAECPNVPLKLARNGLARQSDLYLLAIERKANAEYQRSMRLRQCLSELEKYDRREKALTELLAGYERVLSDYAREVEAGQVSVLDYLTVLRNKIQTERDALLMRTNRQLVIAAYNYWNH